MLFKIITLKLFSYLSSPIGQDDTTSLASQMTSTDSGIWSENGITTVRISSDVKSNDTGARGHYREDSGSSGFGSVSSHNGGARPKLNTLTHLPPAPESKVCKLASAEVKAKRVLNTIEQGCRWR